MGQDRRGGRMMRDSDGTPPPPGHPVPGSLAPAEPAEPRHWWIVSPLVRFLVVLLPVLGLAVMVSLLPRFLEGTQQSEPAAAIVPAALSAPEAALENELAALVAGFDGEAGLAVQDIATGRILHARGDELYPQQSVSKFWVALAALDEADEGRFDLAEPVTLRAEDLTLFHQPIREIVRSRGRFDTDYGDLLDRALTRSDNTANDRILRRIGGPETVQDFIDDAELAGIRFGTDERTKQSGIAGLQWDQAYSMGRGFYDARDALPDALRRARFEAYLADPVDGASPIGIAHALGQLARGSLLSSVSTELLLATLEQTRSGPRRLKGGVPPGWTIAHKTGTGQEFGGEQSGYNDIGIVTSPAGREYAVVAMIRRTGAPVPARMAMMQELVRAVVRYDEAAYPPPPGAQPVSGAVTTEP
ncbi:MAG: class A beta-lactamase-related serine hydrolase [Alphaproteobacteria bacterium]|nr:class A beta-lactamase-related serine hydrolase [Alphaproteobacteria bacterium]